MKLIIFKNSFRPCDNKDMQDSPPPLRKCIENWCHFEYKNDHNSKNKNRKNRKFGFSFYSVDSGSFMDEG